MYQVHKKAYEVYVLVCNGVFGATKILGMDIIRKGYARILPLPVAAPFRSPFIPDPPSPSEPLSAEAYPRPFPNALGLIPHRKKMRMAVRRWVWCRL